MAAPSPLQTVAAMAAPYVTNKKGSEMLLVIEQAAVEIFCLHSAVCIPSCLKTRRSMTTTI